MKRYLFALFIAVFSFSIVSAQSSMTDEQIMQFVIKEHKAGASQSQIVTKLMQKGVDISQIRRIKAKYERLSKNGGLGLVMDETVGKAEETMRSNNGDTRESLGLAKNGKTKLKNKKKNGKNSKSSKDANEKSSQRMGAVKSVKGKNVNGLPDEEDDELFFPDEDLPEIEEETAEDTDVAEAEEEKPAPKARRGYTSLKL